MIKPLKSFLGRLKGYKYIDQVFPLLASSVYAFFTLSHINGAGIWFDEAFSAYLTKFNLFEIAKYTALDVHPPMYYWLLKIWTDIFGHSELAFRSLSVVFGVSAIFIAYALIKKMFSARAAMIGVLMMAFSPMLVRYGMEARMYTMVATIGLGATYVLIDAVKTDSKKKWTIYGILVGLGMWTHYFTAIIWLSHWFWRYLVTKNVKYSWRQRVANYFSRHWIRAHVVAVIVFMAWLPVMIIELGGIQSTNFWIGPAGINSFTNYLTNTFYYLEYQQVINYPAAALIAVSIFMIFAGFKVYKKLDADKQSNYLLLVSMSCVSPLILILASLPPLKPAFVERYLLTASITFLLLLGVNLHYYFEGKKLYKKLAVFLVLLAMLAFGISNVYHYGNYNKNTSTSVTTREVVREINSRSGTSIPIIADNPWIFYEAISYDSAKNPIFFVNETTDYKYGSLAMLKENDMYKIKSFEDFLKTHSEFWYIGFNSDGSIEAPFKNICAIDRFEITDKVDGKTNYKATKYEVCESN